MMANTTTQRTANAPTAIATISPAKNSKQTRKAIKVKKQDNVQANSESV